MDRDTHGNGVDIFAQPRIIVHIYGCRFIAARAYGMGVTTGNDVVDARRRRMIIDSALEKGGDVGNLRGCGYVV